MTGLFWSKKVKLAFRNILNLSSFLFEIIQRENVLNTFAASSSWTKEEDELLLKLLSENSLNACNENNQNKKKYFHNKSPQHIMNRWNKVINPSLINGNWSKEEEELIIK